MLWKNFLRLGALVVLFTFLTMLPGSRVMAAGACLSASATPQSLGAPVPLSCPQKFYQALGQISEDKISHIRPALKNLAQGQKTLPGKWVFTPRHYRIETYTKRVCTKSRRRWNKRRKRRIKRCVRWRTKTFRRRVKLARYSTKSLGYFKTARPIILAKGGDINFRRKRSFHWVTNRVAIDLSTFAKQDFNPAICTGSLFMIDYFEKHLGRLKKYISNHTQSHTEINDSIRAELKMLRLDMSAMKFGHPGWGGAPLNSAHKWRFETLLNSASTVETGRQDALHTLSESMNILSMDMFDMRGDDHNFPNLSGLKHQALSNQPHQFCDIIIVFFQSGKGRYSSAVQTRLKLIYSLLEARFYLNSSVQKYQNLSELLFGSFKAIRVAHRQNCHCK